MSSIFQQAMGDDFKRLHPMMRRRFSVGLASGEACVGRGVMRRIHVRAPWVRAFLRFGSTRNILVPRPGQNIPFEISNYPYLDPFGRETITYVRRFHYPGRSERFDATMIGTQSGIVDYLGTHQHLATDLSFRATEDGGLVIRSGEQRFYAGAIAFPFPQLLTGRALVRERFDEPSGRFRITVGVHHPQLGLMLGYDGSFTCEFLDAHDAPAALKPVRHEHRS